MRKLVILCLAGFAGPVWSQSSPILSHVVTTGLLDTSFAPGTTVYIFGTFAMFAAGRDFSINVGGATGEINVADNTLFITAQIPLAAPVGQQSLTIVYQGQTSNALPVTIAAYAPEFSGTGVTITGSTAPPQFGPYYPFNHGRTGKSVTPDSPALPGEPIISRAYGLGATATTPTLTIAGENVPLAMQETAGSSTIDFFVPQDAVLGFDPVILTVGGVNSNTAYLPVGTVPAIGRVLNGGSFRSPGTAAPGTIVSLFGENFGTQDNLYAFPNTTVNGDTVMFGNTPAPIFALAAAEGQINVLVPDELPTTGSVSVTLQTPTGTSKTFSLNLAPATPGIFFYSDPLDPTRRNAVAVMANTAWIAMPLSMAPSLGLPTNCAALGAGTVCAEPLHPSDYVLIYATGLGVATPKGDPNGAVLPTGQLAPANGSPLYSTIATPTVTIGGLAAPFLFSGIAPGYSGVYAVIVQVPANVTPSDDVPVKISMPGGASDTATIAVQAK